MEFKQERQTFWVSNSSKKIKISVLTPEIIRIFEDHGETGNSYAIEGNKEIKTKVEVEQSKKQIIIRTAALHLKVDEDLHIDVFNEKDQPLIQDYLGKRIPLDREINSEQKKLAEEEGHQIASDQK
ncbi:DUF4968 domain-containing protein, partial [Lactobacillus acetotolerans]